MGVYLSGGKIHCRPATPEEEARVRALEEAQEQAEFDVEKLKKWAENVLPIRNK